MLIAKIDIKRPKPNQPCETCTSTNKDPPPPQLASLRFDKNTARNIFSMSSHFRHLVANTGFTNYPYLDTPAPMTPQTTTDT